MPLPLFDEPRVEVKRIAVDGIEANLYWRYFREGREGQSFTFRDEDESLVQYAKDGYRLGRLAAPLPCMKEKR